MTDDAPIPPLRWTRPLRRLLDRFAPLVVRYRALGLVAACIVMAISALIVRDLRFDGSFAALLRPDTPELVEVNRLIKRAGGTTELVIAISGADPDARLSFGRAITRALRDDSSIRSADVEYPIEFFTKRRLLLLPLKQLRKLDRAVAEEIERATARANPFYVDLEDDQNRRRNATPWADVDSAGLRAHKDLLRRTFTSPDGKYLFVRVRPKGTSYDMGTGAAVLAKIKATVASVHPNRSGLNVRYAGSLELNQEQHLLMTTDLRNAALMALVLILLLLTLYIRRIAAPLILALPLIGGVVTTLAITTLTIGQLNLVSGFLVSALFGLGIDFEIHLYLRYLETLDAGTPRILAMRDAVLETLPPCVTAALTTSGAFFAMCVADFRGFREYGVIAGMGVLVMLGMTFVLLPPLALLLSRRERPRRPNPVRVPPRALVWAVVGAGAAFFFISLTLVPRVRWHNDFRKLRGTSEKVDFSYYVAESLGGDLSPAAIYVDNLQQARRVDAYLRTQEQGPHATVRSYLSLAHMVPRHAQAKRAILQRIAHRLDKLRGKRLKPADRKKIDELRGLVAAQPWTLDQVPEVFRRPLTTLDGNGQFVAVWSRGHTDVDRDIIAWGRTLERFRTDLRAQGIPVAIMDETRVSARVLTVMRHDAPLVFTAAALAVLLFLVLHFRYPRHVLVVAGSLAVGIVWMLGLMALWGIDLNVFNQAVVATVMGTGIDNAVHIYHRYLKEGRGSMPTVLASTGSAAVLASATTIIGFGTAITAHHLGIRSFGWLAIAGLSSVFASTTVFLPAVLIAVEGWVSRRRAS